MGLVVYSGESFTQCPLTSDHAVLINLFKDIESGMIEDGTAIGDGLATSINRLKESDAISKVIILITDGVNNSGSIDPLSAAEIAKIYGIRIYTVGVGTMGVAPYPVQTPFGIQYQNLEVKIDEDILKQVAEVTGGQYYGPGGKNERGGYPVDLSSSEASHNHADAEKLWEISEDLTGIHYNWNLNSSE